ncbi:hypothetical protein N9R68_03325 [Porticoccaceae bacterium]|nr:hypothetical protein [Porticoccaceae bacterium]MDB2382684.1 hypothetical protein [Porticoccaceae bacterium]MDB2566192.1 hypothetical protein [Porticoccaceae bacterium]MDB2620503.1 hypothetical protein [Porticoccaceae bacterium]MDB2669174.1 hypothetical protein [Porticoccaceae bacterium]
MKGLVKSSVIAYACLYLSSQQAAYFYGAWLGVDGGGEVSVFLDLAYQ